MYVITVSSYGEDSEEYSPAIVLFKYMPKSADTIIDALCKSIAGGEEESPEVRNMLEDSLSDMPLGDDLARILKDSGVAGIQHLVRGGEG